MNSIRLLEQRIMLLKNYIEAIVEKLPNEKTLPSDYEELILRLEVMTLLFNYLTSELKHARWNLVDVNSPEFH